MSPPLHRGDQSELCAYPLVVTASSVEAVSIVPMLSRSRVLGIGTGHILSVLVHGLLIEIPNKDFDDFLGRVILLGVMSSNQLPGFRVTKFFCIAPSSYVSSGLKQDIAVVFRVKVENRTSSAPK
ncbi:hypothetical protein PPTG_20823 [Phytophthora nicotianae INRA-310]|uniref:Uncharacterized protein n=1 Tax=Phytophthora nicotianae (strain INRA-310) TaxID=761204 RepID=W2RHC4_PHYN3|nr:hypothetical protein PPTG_20823 [Phytophthora nicotianae INRA-310]ETN24803.1 hypothetical protein PPTG_20823 [Phytophthora nicotianae INRA-310]